MRFSKLTIFLLLLLSTEYQWDAEILQTTHCTELRCRNSAPAKMKKNQQKTIQIHCTELRCRNTALDKMNTTQQKLYLLSGEYQQDAEILHFVQWLNTLKFTALS